MPRRLVILRVLVVLAFALILARLVQLQLIEGERNRKLADENRIRVVRRLAPRGTIYDRRGRVLATSRLAFSICAVPEELQGGGSDAAETVARMLGLPADQVRAALAQPRPARYEPQIIWRDASDQVVASFEEHAVYLSGLSVVADAVRQYPQGSLAAHVLGYVRQISAEDLAGPDKAGYQPRDLIGKAGAERMAEPALRGTDGGDQIEVDARGRRVRTLGTVPPQPGRDVWLTLDLELQQAAEEALGGRAGAVVALDPWTGEVLAMASHPAYDPNVFSGTLTPSQWRSLATPDHPLQNRAATCRYEPGSVFKIVTAAAALEAGDTGPDDRFYCGGVFALGGWRMRCWKRDGHGSEDFIHGFGQSCNVMFATIGRRAGPERLAAMARRFGLGQKTGIGLPEEAGLIPSPEWKRRVRKQPWYPGDTAQMSIGQGDCLVTPLQVAREAAAVANGGYLVRPKLIARIEGEDPPRAQLPGQPLGLRAETLAALRAGMEAVVAEGGTAHRIWTDKYGLAGKTGTAQNPGGTPHAWFAGYAPTDRPRLAVAVMVEHGGAGAAVAAPIARHVFDTMLLPPTQRSPWPKPTPARVPHLPAGSGRHQ
jgi:penicillin-binding protein 2